MPRPQYNYSGVCYVAAAGQTVFNLTTTGGDAIDYMAPEHIGVRTSTDEGATWVTLNRPADWDFNDPPTSITLTTGVAVDTWVDIRRTTPRTDDQINFNAGNLLTADQLNEFERWQLFIDQEILDQLGNIDAGVIGLDDTDDLPEGTVNLYYTDARVENWINTNLSDTDDLAEGTGNLYYTDARVQAVIDSGGYITDPGVASIVAGTNISIDPAGGTGAVTINAQGGINYQGTIDATGAAPAATQGDFYINTATSGTIDASWTPLGGTVLAGSERLIYDGTEWSILPMPTVDLSNYVQSGGNVSVLNNDAGYLTAADTVNFVSSGDNVSVLNNDAGYLTAADTVNFVTSGDLVAFDYVASGDNVSVLANDAGYLTAADTVEFVTSADLVAMDFVASGDNVSVLTNDAGYLTTADVGDFVTSGDLAGMDLVSSGDIVAMDFVASGDNVSVLTNDAGFITDAPLSGGPYVRDQGGWDTISVSVQTATDTVEGVVKLRDTQSSSLDVTDGIALTPKALATETNAIYTQLNTKLNETQANLKYVSLSAQNNNIGGFKSWTNQNVFLNGVRVDETLQVGKLDVDANYLNIYLESTGSGYRKVISAVGNGPILVEDSKEFSKLYVRNSGGSQGNFWLNGNTNGPGAIFQHVNPEITRIGPDSSSQITSVDVIGVKPSFDQKEGSFACSYIAHLTCLGDRDSTGFSGATSAMYGVYVKSQAGSKSTWNSFRGFYSELNEQGSWHFQGTTTRAMGTSGPINAPDVYNGGPGNGPRNVTIDAGGWLGTNSYVFYMVESQTAIASVTYAALHSTLTPRLVRFKAEEEEYPENKEAEWNPKTAHKHSPRGWEQFRLDPTEVAAIHPRLAHYRWPTKKIVIREPKTHDEFDPGLESTVRDFDQQPTPDGVDYEGITTVLVGVVQELRAEINTLKTEVAELKGKQ